MAFLRRHISIRIPSLRSAHLFKRKMSTRAMAPFLLTPRELKSAVASTDAGKNVVTLDASWHMPNSPRRGGEEYKTKHLPGARFLDLDAVASPHELGLKHMLPSPEQFAKACGE